MNDPLSHLGESLADDFQNKLNHWLALDSVFSAENVFGSIDSILADMNADEKWENLTATPSSFETDFLPEDLVDGFFENPVPEQDSENSPSQKRNPNQPTASTFNQNNFTNKSNSIGNDERIRLSSFSLNDDEATAKHSSSISENDDRPDNGKRRSHADDFTDESYNSLGQYAGTDEKTQLIGWDQIDHSQEESSRSRQKGLSSDPTPSLNKTSKPERSQLADDDSSNSIWTTPLRNLTDFAGQVSRPLSNGSKNSQEGTNRLQSSTENVSPVSIASIDQFVGKPIEGWLNISDWTSNQNSINQSTTDSQSTGNIPVSASNLQSEYNPFPAPAPQQPKIPDTEELLEALTARILRDFRSYYP